MSEVTIEKVTVRRGTDHITIKYVEGGQAKTLIISARDVVRNWDAVKQMDETVRPLRIPTVKFIGKTFDGKPAQGGSTMGEEGAKDE